MDKIVQTKPKKGVISKDKYDSEVRKLSKENSFEHKGRLYQHVLPGKFTSKYSLILLFVLININN